MLIILAQRNHSTLTKYFKIFILGVSLMCQAFHGNQEVGLHC